MEKGGVRLWVFSLDSLSEDPLRPSSPHHLRVSASGPSLGPWALTCCVLHLLRSRELAGDLHSHHHSSGPALSPCASTSPSLMV